MRLQNETMPIGRKVPSGAVLESVVVETPSSLSTVQINRQLMTTSISGADCHCTLRATRTRNKGVFELRLQESHTRYPVYYGASAATVRSVI